MDLGIPHIRTKNMFESNPLKSRFLVRGLTVPRRTTPHRLQSASLLFRDHPSRLGRGFVHHVTAKHEHILDVPVQLTTAARAACGYALSRRLVQHTGGCFGISARRDDTVVAPP